MPTKLRPLARQAITADTTPVAVTITGVIGQTYKVALYVSGATDCFITPGVGSAGTTGMRIATLTHEEYGPFDKADGAVAIYSSAPCACVATVLDVRSES